MGHFVGEQVLLYAGCSFAGVGPLVLKDDVFVNRGCYFDLQAPITIGSGTRVGDHVRLITSTHEIGTHDRRAGAGKSTGISVGNGVWLGSGSTILPGVSIGDGCIIAAGSIVTRSTMADGLYAGVPARRVRDLDEDRPPAKAEQASEGE